MTASLTFTQPHQGGRILLMLGEHQVGAVFPPSAVDLGRRRPVWRWSWWLSNGPRMREGQAKSEQAAKDALLAEARDWLKKAGVE